MTVTQKRILLVVAFIGLVYFAIFIFPNAVGAKDQSILTKTSTDEPLIYPFVVRMLQDPTSLKNLLVNWIIYQDYHYGWLFYLWSALVLLPVKAVFGMGYLDHLQLNILLVRQLVSVLPLVLAIIGLVYLQTRFRSWIKTLALFFLMLSIRGVLQMDIQFWHPDALSVLSVVAVLFFLERDRLKFGRNFYFAAAACGISIGIKLAGVFFAVAIAAYLIVGVVKRILIVKRAMLHAVLFLATMTAALVFTNPFLLNSTARAEMITIQSRKTLELSVALGYPQDYVADYQLGPEHWDWTFRTFFGSWPLLGFVFLSLLAGCFWGPNKFLNRLILAYIIPQTIYLFYFVAPKPDYYFMPVMLPMFSAMLCLPEAVKEFIANRPGLKFRRSALIVPAVTLSVGLIMVGFFYTNLTRNFSGFYARYTSGLAVEQNLLK